MPSIIASLIIIDQASKYLIRHTGGFYICNKGIAFGITLPEAVFYVFWIAIISIFSVLYLKGKHNNAYVLILSGAISNIIDRITYGCVTDFIDLKFWPVFNLADILITIGVIMLILQIKKHK